VEGRPGALLHVRLLLQRPEPPGGPGRGEAPRGAEGALRLQVLLLLLAAFHLSTTAKTLQKL